MKLYLQDIIPKSQSPEAARARCKFARKLRLLGVRLATDYTTHDILAFYRLPGVQEKLKLRKPGNNETELYAKQLSV